MTLPFSSIVTRTVTAPDALTAFAIGGYDGLTKFVALPFKTPRLTTLGGILVGVGVGGGVGVGVAGVAVAVGFGVGVVSGVLVGLGVALLEFGEVVGVALPLMFEGDIELALLFSERLELIEEFPFERFID